MGSVMNGLKHIQYEFSHTIVIYPLPSAVLCPNGD
jgi:hypothetical protein